MVRFVYGIVRASQIPDEAIGFAQGSTDIALNGSLDLTFLFLAAGVLAVLAAAFLIFRGVRFSRRK